MTLRTKTNLQARYDAMQAVADAPTSQEPSFTSVLVAMYKFTTNQLVSNWLLRYDAWLTQRARLAAYQWRIPDIWQDLKSEMILQAYEIGNRFNPSFGTPLDTFIITSLWHYAEKPEIVKRYATYQHGSAKFAIQKRASTSNRANGEFTDDGVDFWATVEVREENTSHEDAERVFSELGELTEYESAMIELRFRQGYTFAQIDSLLGIGRGGAAWRMNNIINKIKVSGDGRR